MDITLRDYQLEAVDAVFQALGEGVRRQLIVLPTGSGKCIRGDTLVATHEGFRPIQAIAAGLEPGSLKEVDLKVWNPEGIFKATHIYSDGIQATVKVTTSRGYELEGTARHRILCLVDGKLEWRFLKDIHPGMRVVLGRGVELFAPAEAVLPGSPEYRTCATRLCLPARIDVDLAEWLGLLAADGGLSVRDWVAYTKAEERLLDGVAARMEMLGLNPRRVVFPGRAPSIVVSSRNLIRWLEAAGLAGRSDAKQVPWPVFLSPPEVAAGFLRGLFTGDAYIQSDCGRIEYTTASERLAREVQVLLLALGIASFRKIRVVGGKPYWRLLISGSSLREFQRRIGFLLPEKQQVLNEAAAKPVNDNRDLAADTDRLLSTIHRAYMKRFGTYPSGYRKSWEAYRSGRRTPSWHKLRQFLEAYAGVAFLDEYQELKKRADRGLLFDTVETWKEGRCPVYDLVVPQSHAFWAGGFINHNTVIFASVARELARPALILAHRDELVRQALEKFQMAWPEACLGIVKAEENDHEGKDVVVASVQTLSRPKRLSQFGPERFGFAVVDEAHHAVARTYVFILERLGFMSGDPDKLLLGVTATPVRGDKVGLGAVFQKIVYQRSLLWMVRAGYLVDFKGLAVDTGADLESVRVVAGDFADADLEGVLNTEDRNGLIVRAYLDHAQGRRAVAFTSGVQHALDLAATFRAAGVPAEAVSGETPEEVRRKLLFAFRAGDVRVLCNCAVLTEGWDEPSLDCILMARPTKSKALYLQMIGRGARPYPGKQDCLIIDFVDNTGRHDVMSLPTLFGLSPESVRQQGLLGAALAKRRRAYREAGVAAAVPAAGVMAREVEILGRSAFRWTVVGDVMRLPVGPKAYIYLRPQEERRDMYYVEYVAAEGEPVRLNRKPLDIGYAQGVAEEYLRRLGRGAAAFAAKDAAWREQAPTEKQVQLLMRLGLWREGMKRGEAADALEVFFAAKEARKGLLARTRQ